MTTFVLDPVCERLLLQVEAEVVLRFRNRLYYFCSKSCCARFEDDPEGFSGTGARPAARRNEG